ncbi:HalOD1 output domain-containing protein [Halobellus rufus]|uniref:HalOD1 output domain-containing protein n=1 Tax=Halobellus rufus TaxID=1448860 RepID=UPI00067846D4|nr:HalOD1 output domain-containing protein [Halobellus rufus]
MTSDPESQRIPFVVVEAVAAAEGVPPMELTPLGEVVDTDAIEALFARPTPTGLEVRFEYEGHTVLIDEERRVRILDE